MIDLSQPIVVLVARRYRTTRRLSNGYAVVRAGTPCTLIGRTEWGIDLVTAPCPDCGAQVILRGVSPFAVEAVDE